MSSVRAVRAGASRFRTFRTLPMLVALRAATILGTS